MGVVVSTYDIVGTITDAVFTMDPILYHKFDNMVIFGPEYRGKLIFTL